MTRVARGTAAIMCRRFRSRASDFSRAFTSGSPSSLLELVLQLLAGHAQVAPPADARPDEIDRYDDDRLATLTAASSFMESERISAGWRPDRRRSSSPSAGRT